MCACSVLFSIVCQHVGCAWSWTPGRCCLLVGQGAAQLLELQRWCTRHDLIPSYTVPAITAAAGLTLVVHAAGPVVADDLVKCSQMAGLPCLQVLEVDTHAFAVDALAAL